MGCDGCSNRAAKIIRPRAGDLLISFEMCLTVPEKKVVMGNLFIQSQRQMARISPHFPLSDGCGLAPAATIDIAGQARDRRPQPIRRSQQIRQAAGLRTSRTSIDGERWCPGTELNRRHCDFQSHALPTELPGHLRTALVGASHGGRLRSGWAPYREAILPCPAPSVQESSSPFGRQAHIGRNRLPSAEPYDVGRG